MSASIMNFARKEFSAWFASPAGYIFIGVFLAINLFVFFWIERFFARNIADVRPLFEWMPLMLAFLVSALTMKSWSEERRTGTLEFLVTSPVPNWQISLGKFLGVMGLVATSLALTLPIPLSVSMIGDLDWGPVVTAYMASLFLAAAYTAVGLYMSARTDNQVVSLISTVLVCLAFYLIGSPAMTSLFGGWFADLMRAIGTGSRFDAITRGVLDMRDIYYYLSITGLFLVLNAYALERLRWDRGRKKPSHHLWQAGTALLAVNLLVGNLWLSQIGFLRADMTDGQIYSVTKATRNVLAQARQPLLVRGYFTDQTHPLLAPLVPRIRDLLKEYEVAAPGNVKVEFVDPIANPDLEEEAVQKFGIQPVTFQSANRYEASVVNSYFNIVVQYGDQHETLGFQDLIEVKSSSETDLDVDLRNPEFDISQAIRKVVLKYNNGGNVLTSLAKPVTLQAYMSDAEVLPGELAELAGAVSDIASKYGETSGGKFRFEKVNPDMEGEDFRGNLLDQYGIRPLRVGLFSDDSFWFSLLLSEEGGETWQISIPQSLDREGLEANLKEGLQRFASGFMKTIALHTPTPDPQMAQYGMGGETWYSLRSSLEENARVIDARLDSGMVPDEADFLLVMSPRDLSEKQVFAIDQFLMKGGSVAIAGATHSVQTHGALSVSAAETGLEDWLAHHGLSLDKGMVIDAQNAPFPVPVQRSIGGLPVREIQMVAYPPFVDVRPDGMNEDNPMTAHLGQMTLTWPSPVTVDAEKNKDRHVTPLLTTTSEAWHLDSPVAQPNYSLHGDFGFDRSGEPEAYTLAAMAEGQFSSWFAGKDSPMLPREDEAAANDEEEATEANTDFVNTSVIDKSASSARLILIGSDSFASDSTLDLLGSTSRSEYGKPLEFAGNIVDWATGDKSLMEIRSRGQFSRTLLPVSQKTRIMLEYGNYGLAVLLVLLLWGFVRQQHSARMQRFQSYAA